MRKSGSIARPAGRGRRSPARPGCDGGVLRLRRRNPAARKSARVIVRRSGHEVFVAVAAARSRRCRGVTCSAGVIIVEGLRRAKDRRAGPMASGAPKSAGGSSAASAPFAPVDPRRRRTASRREARPARRPSRAARAGLARRTGRSHAGLGSTSSTLRAASWSPACRPRSSAPARSRSASEGGRAAIGLMPASRSLSGCAGSRAVRAHRATAVLVGIDQRRQLGRTFQRRIERAGAR